jgi:hypothetical protein
LFGNRVFRETMELKWGCGGGPQSNMFGVLIKRAIWTLRETHKEENDRKGHRENATGQQRQKL